MRGIFGLNLRDSFAFFDPLTFCWRTSQATLISDLDQYWETWPDAGTMRNGVVYELATSEPVISESGSSSWPTPDAQLMNDGADPEKHRARQERLKALHHNGNGAGTPLGMAVLNWPTPRREDGGSLWRTPNATEADHGGDRKDEMGLDQQGRNWATPRTSDHKGSGPEGSKSHQHMLDRDYLCAQIQSFHPSLPAPATPAGPPSSESGPTSRQLWASPRADQGASHKATPGGQSVATQAEECYPQEKRRLNPRFVEWLMGFPISWTEL